ncbi:hypothetical protein [Hymenobacter psychrophilus]|uniref:Uncharacterized protein n=1 Tax=Hymenobacter psychrophilus TaxID=651662 RepID=A0A1H3FR03_9BACT|nr:hypothetical protein [Hymenobacter psychrophilus]SDX93285.1 hypothetical protein SAMN04488069_104187 [Hymenobacter psychrophilus]
MSNLSISRYWLMLVLLTGCQSTRPASFSFAQSHTAPSHAEYYRRQPAPAGVIAEVELAQLTASLPDTAADTMPARRSGNLAAYSSRALPKAAVILPDTVTERLSQPLPAGKPDPLTTVVNVSGAVSLLAGVGLIAAGAYNDKGGLSGLGYVLFALPLLVIGVPLLLFQGKNGRQRKRHEARVAARQPTAVPATNSPAANRPLKRLGVSMMLATGLLLLLGLLGGPGGVALATFVGLPLAVVGLVFFIVGS